MQPTIQAQLIQWFLTIAFPILAAVAFRALRLYGNHIQDARLREIALDLVTAVEQQFPMLDGEAKLNAVTAQAKAQGTPLDRPKIEAAVYQLNAAKPQVLAAPAAPSPEVSQ